jgi:hypothetical protein
MQLLSEKKSPDGTVVAKIYDDGDGGYLLEKWVSGHHVGAVPFNPGTSLNEVAADAASWVGSYSQLNG